VFTFTDVPPATTAPKEGVIVPATFCEEGLIEAVLRFFVVTVNWEFCATAALQDKIKAAIQAKLLNCALIFNLKMM
jgi:hypothetical protein